MQITLINGRWNTTCLNLTCAHAFCVPDYGALVRVSEWLGSILSPCHKPKVSQITCVMKPNMLVPTLSPKAPHKIQARMYLDLTRTDINIRTIGKEHRTCWAPGGHLPVTGLSLQSVDTYRLSVRDGSWGEGRLNPFSTHFWPGVPTGVPFR